MGRYSIHPFQTLMWSPIVAVRCNSLLTNSIVAKRPMTDGEDYNLAGLAAQRDCR